VLFREGRPESRYAERIDRASVRRKQITNRNRSIGGLHLAYVINY
jgi:hypothetical protein